MTQEQQSYAPVTYFALTFLLSWLVWVPCALDHFGWLPFKIPEAVVTFAGIGALGPALAALIVTFAGQREAGVRSLLQPLRRWSVGWRWVAAAVAAYPALLLLSGGLYNSLGGTPPLTPVPTSVSSLLSLGVILLITVLGEEIGWRGYALPALQTRWNALWSSLILGTVTTAWHLPFWLIQPTFEQYGWGYLGLNWLWILAVTIFLTWLANNSRNGLLLAVLFHWCVNMVNVGYLQVTGAIEAFVLLIGFSWALAIVLVVVFGPERLVRRTSVDALQRIDMAR